MKHVILRMSSKCILHILSQMPFHPSTSTYIQAMKFLGYVFWKTYQSTLVLSMSCSISLTTFIFLHLEDPIQNDIQTSYSAFNYTIYNVWFSWHMNP